MVVPINNPFNPNNVVSINKIILYVLKALDNSIDWKVKPAIEEIAIMIIIIGDTIPALTAASPKINPPSIEIEEPADVDMRKSASFNISKQMIIKSASI